MMNQGENGHLKASVDFEEICKLIDELPTHQKAELGQRLLGRNSGLTVILGGNNVVNNSFALQLNQNSEDLKEQLKDIPTNVLVDLLEAISMRIKEGFSGS